MKVTYGPVVSSASGRFGGTVASSWKGVSLFRQFRSPSQPQSATQVEVRNIFRNLTRQYSLMGTYWKAAWESFATGKALIGRNVFIQKNVPALKGQAALAAMLGTPGDSSTVPPVSMVLTHTPTTITATVTVPSAPTGWTLTSVVAVAIPSKDYGTVQSAANLTPSETRDATAPYAPQMTGLTAQLYEVFAFIEWTAPDGSVRYSAAIQGTDTPA